MTKTRLCLCGPRPKGTVSGVALAFELLVKGGQLANLDLRVIDASFGGSVKKSGVFSLGRAGETLMVIARVWWQLLFCDIYYATMSTSALGFIRDLATVSWAALLRRRVVLHLHGGGFADFYLSQRSWMQALICWNLKHVDSIIVLGELLKDQFYCVGDFVKPKLVVVPNGLTLGVDEPDIEYKKLSDDEPVQLLYLSSLMQSKGFIDVLQAVSLLQKEIPGKAHLHLCGNFVDAKTEEIADIYDEDSLMDFIRDNELEAAVTYHRQVSGAEKDQRFRSAHIFLLPTNYPWEGQPLSIIEALAYATPVISCKHKGVPELVSDGESGFLVNSGSSTAIASAVRKLVADEQDYSRMSKAARQHYELNFRREKHLKKLLAVILDCPESAIADMNV